MARGGSPALTGETARGSLRDLNRDRNVRTAGRRGVTAPPPQRTAGQAAVFFRTS